MYIHTYVCTYIHTICVRIACGSGQHLFQKESVGGTTAGFSKEVADGLATGATVETPHKGLIEG